MVYEAYESAGRPGEYLAHHGIIGMKWGIRRFQNPDGTLTEEGRQRYYGKAFTDQFAKDLRAYDQYGRGANGKYIRIANSVQMKNIASRVRGLWEQSKSFQKKLTKTEKDFFKRKDYKQWVRRAAEKTWEEYNKNGDLEKGWGSFENFFNWYLNDDGDQGTRTTQSFDLWLKESGEKAAKEYLQNEKIMIGLNKKYTAECKKAVQEFMGEHGDETYDTKSHYGNQTFKHDVADRGVIIVNRIMNTWDTFGDDFDSPVPIEGYMRLVN